MVDSFVYPASRICVFSKASRVGEVKTRLIPYLGAQAATELHARLFQQSLSMVISSGLAPVEIWCSPSASETQFQSFREQYGVSLHDQQGSNLGERMAHATADVLARAEQLIIIGSDCPQMDRHYVEMALQALQSGNDSVLGPAEDGGYVLIGLKKNIAQIFENIAWSSNQVLEQTLTHMRTLGLTYQLLDTLWDVDRYQDYQRYLQLDN